jgi:hypothetical protein
LQENIQADPGELRRPFFLNKERGDRKKKMRITNLHPIKHILLPFLNI